MWRAMLLGVLAHAVIAGTALAQRPSNELRALRDSVLATERSFLRSWTAMWRYSEGQRHTFTFIGDAAEDATPRRQAHHCHPDFFQRQRKAPPNLIQSKGSMFAVCPSWDLGDVAENANERLRIDDALVDSLIPVARGYRASLIARFDSVIPLLPTDDLLVGQYVRLLVDQWEHSRALAATESCGARPWWCSALKGYVLTAQGRILAADSAFEVSLSQMPESERCRWNDHRLLIDFDSRQLYPGDCKDRDSANARLWWLADPMFSEPGNERKVEQHARMVLLALRTQSGLDERFAYGRDRDDDARQVMVLRYGWPSYLYWGGPGEDIGHTGYLAQRGAPASPPYTTFEYFAPRAHVIPRWSAIADPFGAHPREWTLIEPDRNEPPVPSMLARVPSDSAGYHWWPVEHFQPARGMTQLFDGQRAMLRRESGALLAISTPLESTRLRRRVGDSLPPLSIIGSTAPGVTTRLAEVRGVVGDTLRARAIIPSYPAVISVEYPSGGTGMRGPAGRMRFGVRPPAALSARTDTSGISDPILLAVPPGAEELPNDVNAALRIMATSHVVPATGKIGVYWETYGIEPADTIELAVWIERYTQQGIVRRFGAALGVATDLNTPIAISWKEPQPGYRSHVFREGGVAVIGRSLSIDVSGLPPGEYRLETAVRIGAGAPYRGRTAFIVRPREGVNR